MRRNLDISLAGAGRTRAVRVVAVGLWALRTYDGPQGGAGLVTLTAIAAAVLLLESALLTAAPRLLP